MRFAVPLVLVPTTYPQLSFADVAAPRKVGLIICAKHAIRAAVAAMRATFARILDEGGIAGVESSIASVAEIFTLQGDNRIVLLAEVPIVLRADLYTVAALTGAAVVVIGAALRLPASERHGCQTLDRGPLSSPAAAQRCAEGAGLDSGPPVAAQSAMPSIALPLRCTERRRLSTKLADPWRLVFSLESPPA